MGTLEGIKFCKTCGCEKTKTFRKTRNTYEWVCKACHNRRNNEYKARNKEKISAETKAYKAKNREAVLEKGKSYRSSEKGKQVYLTYYQKNGYAIRSGVKNYRESLGKEVCNKKSLEWAKKNPDKRKTIRSNWKKRNKSKVNSDTAMRFAKRQRATVKWANRFFIDEAYSLAQLRESVTGLEWHVDHIIPIRSDLVSGLHCESNLRVILADDNMSKGNRWWPDMPEYSAQDLHELRYFKWLAENANLDNNQNI